MQKKEKNQIESKQNKTKRNPNAKTSNHKTTNEQVKLNLIFSEKLIIRNLMRLGDNLFSSALYSISWFAEFFSLSLFFFSSFFFIVRVIFHLVLFVPSLVAFSRNCNKFVKLIFDTNIFFPYSVWKLKVQWDKGTAFHTNIQISSWMNVQQFRIFVCVTKHMIFNRYQTGSFNFVHCIRHSELNSWHRDENDILPSENIS